MFLKLTAFSFVLVLSSILSNCEILLPGNTEPLSYYLSLTSYIHEDDYMFFGFVDIHIRALDTSDTITLHAENLSDIEVTLRGTESDHLKSYHSLNFTEDKENDLLRIETPVDVVLEEGREYTLSISFEGRMANESYGFYKLDFVDSENRRVILAATQFENIFARRVFPCYDEPKYKAKFTIALTHGKDFKAYSNMPQNGPSIADGDLVTTKFQDTPPLPVYAIAFILVKGYKEYEIKGTKSSVQQRIIAQDVKNPESMNFYSSFVGEVFHNFEEYFGKLDHLPKLDHVSVPRTASGGMENWGLIIYNALYFKLPMEEEPAIKINIHSTMAHEIGHMWFGNTITVKRWEDIWITESLATFYGWKIYEMTKPGRNIFNYSISHISDYVFTSPDSHSLSKYVNSKNPNDIGMYDYYKGASFIKMIESALSKKTMDKAIRNLIKKFHYSNFDEDDLLTELQIAATEDRIQLFEHPGSLERVFKSWFHKPYYPIVTVTRSYETGDLTISQRSCLNKDTQLWDIPINFATSKEQNFEETSAEYIIPKVSVLTIKANGKFVLDENEWIMMNKQQTGTYVVNYDRRNWEIIAEVLAYDHESIHFLNRAQIVRDLMVIYGKDLISVETVFDVLSYLSQETDLTVWRSARNTLMYFNTLLKGGKAERKYKEFVQEMMKEILDIVKIVSSDSTDEGFLSDTRIALLELACEVDHKGCLKWTESQLLNTLENRLNFDYSTSNLILFNGPKLLANEAFQNAKEKSFEKENGMLYYGLLQNQDSSNIYNLLNESIAKDENFIISAFEVGLHIADFLNLGDFFKDLSKSKQDTILNKLFSVMEKDSFPYDLLFTDIFSIDHAKIMFNEKLFALFRISEEGLTTVPNYRLNPYFADRDNKAYEWLNEYELSFIYPTEETLEISTVYYAPEEEESTFSVIFVDPEDSTPKVKVDTSDKEISYVGKITTTQSLIDDYDEEFEGEMVEELGSDENSELDDDDVEDEEEDEEAEDNNTVESLLPPFEVSKGDTNLPSFVEEEIRTISNLSSGILFRSLSLVTFMVVPFVIVL